MKLFVRTLFALVVTALITASPATARASEIAFSFGDGDGSGIIIWDGALDVATMQNSCPALLCITTPLGGLAPNAVQVLLSSVAPVTFSDFTLNLVLSAPSAGFPFADCATYFTPCQSTFSILNNYNGFECLDQGVLANCEADPGTNSVAILPMALVGPGPVGNGSLFQLQPFGLNFLNANLAFWQTARVGFEMSFVTDQPDIPTNFTLSLQSPGTPPAAVPEPGTMLLLGSGLAVAARRMRRGVKAR